MASFKGILKKISGGLKMAAAYAPGVLALAGVLVAFGGVIGAAVYEDKIEEFKETPVYIQAYEDDFESAKTSFKNEEISFEEYQSKINYLGNKDYIKETIENSESEETLEYKNYLKQQDISKTVAFSGLGVFGACGVLSLVWFVGPVADNIITSAGNDFDYESDYEMDRERRMREEENRKKLEEEIKKLKEQDKFLMQDKDEDEEDKDLPDIAETYYKD